MQRKLFGAALLLGLAVLPAFAADEKKDDKKEPAEKLVSAGTASGKIRRISLAQQLHDGVYGQDA